MNCREPISTDILPESKQQALAAAEQEYEAKRDLIRAKKGAQNSREGDFSLDIGDLSSFD